MRRVVAHILVCVMFLTTVFQNVEIVQAANEKSAPLEFQLTREMLKLDSTGLVVAERDSSSTETALAKFNASTAGLYTLRYYVETAGGRTKQIDFNFHNVDTEKVNLSITTQDVGSSNPDTNTYIEYEFNNQNQSWNDTGVKTENVTSINKELHLGTGKNRENQEFNIALSTLVVNENGNQPANLGVRVKATGNYIYVYTTGITKGNITPFELYYSVDTNNPSTTPIATTEIFNGPKSFSITPTHFYKDENGDLADLDFIEDINQVKPGSVPGVKVNFAQVKKLSGTKFEYIHNIANQVDSNITLQLGTRYTIGDISNALRLDFTPTDGAGIKVDLKDVPEYSSNVVKVESNNTVSLYLSQTDIEANNAPNIIVWDALETSTIIDASFQYGNQAEKYWPDNKGYTYLGYTLNKTSSNQVQINIQPYNIKSRATYSIYILNNKDTDRTSPSVVYEYDPNKTETTNITAIVPAQSPSFFQVVVNIDKNTFVSQMVYYDPNLYPAVPETTEILTIDDVYVVPNETSELETAQPQAIGFDMVWRAPNNVAHLLKDNKLYYELLLRKDPTDYDPISNTGGSTEDIYATYSKIFEVSLNAKGEVVVNTVAGTAGKDYNDTPELRYNEVNDTFSMENVSLMNFGTTNHQWEQIEIQGNHLSVKSGEYLDIVKGKEADSLGNRVVPGTYYLSFRTVLTSNTQDIPLVYSEESNMVAISLDNTDEVIPVPYNISGTDTSDIDKTVISEKITINNVDIRNYVKKMLEPAELYLYQDEAKTTGRFSGEYEIYLYQDSNELAHTVSGVDKGTITPVKVAGEDGKLDLRNNDNYKEQLRDGKVIPISVPVDSLIGDDQTEFEIIGLEPNEVYYVKIRVKLNPWRYTLDNRSPRYSLFSKEFTFTTTTKPVPPSPEDKVPPTPEKIWVEEQPNNTTAIIGFEPPKFEQGNDIEKTYYEFIRTELQLKNEEREKTIEELVAGDSERVGFRTDSPTESNPFMSTYTSEVPNWTNLTPAQPSNKYQLLDDTLNPNNIYYYYVRTVCVMDGEIVKSDWIMVPVTTEPVLPVINLKVESPKDYDHDVKNEVVISFDAPVPSESEVPDNYSFDIAVQGSGSSEYLVNHYNAIKVTSKADNSLTPTGYTHFVYKLTDLKPNSRYYIKVRVVDKTKEVTNGGNYPASLYCDPVTTRTDYDEEEQEKDDKYEEYLKEFDIAVEKIKNRPYWEVEEGYRYKYRENYIETELGLQNEYELVVEEDSNDAYYYMPASLFNGESDVKTTFKITLGDVTANIRPYTLTEENEEIKEAIDLIEENSIEDYYVGISFKTRDSIDRINGETPVSPQMTIDIELVYSKTEDLYVEEDIMSALTAIIAEEREDVVKRLEKKIYNGKIDHDVLEEIIDDAVAEVKESHMKKVDRILDKAVKREVSITEVEKPILLVVKTDSFAVNGYYLITNWMSVPTYAVGSGFGLEATKLGTYIMTGQVSLILTVPSMAPYQSFISKYNLTDFFTITSTGIKTTVTKQQLYGAVARIIGASRGTDYTIYLRNNGIKGISNIGTNNTIRQDEAIYLIMQGYEKIHKRPVSAIVIRNRQGVQNIGAFQTPYRNYVYAAVELKIVNNPNSKVLPSKQLSVEEIIPMLYKAQL